MTCTCHCYWEGIFINEIVYTYICICNIANIYIYFTLTFKSQLRMSEFKKRTLTIGGFSGWKYPTSCISAKSKDPLVNQDGNETWI